MKRTFLLRAVAIVGAAALGLAACGDGGGEPEKEKKSEKTEKSAEPTEEPEEEVDPVEELQKQHLANLDVPGWGDETFTLGRVLPETGFLDYLGVPMITGVQLAVDEMNEAGGVLGKDVELLEFDSGTDPAIAIPNVAGAMSEGADVLVGAAASGVTMTFVETLSREGIYACSGSATSPEFIEMEAASTFFRTAPPDRGQAEIIGDTVVANGHAENVVILHRSDDYGVELAELIGSQIGALGGTVADTISYTDETTFEAEADEAISAEPTAVVVIGFREAGELIGKLVDGGLDPATFYGSDGVFSAQLPEIVGGSADVIDGMTVTGASGSEEFNQRLVEAGVNDFIYGAQTYDCAILFGLWAVASGTDNAGEWDPAAVRDLTSSDGTECSGFAECAELLESGEQIFYQGGSGQILLAEGVEGGGGNLGNPSRTTYAIAQFQDGGVLETVDSVDIELGSN